MKTLKFFHRLIGIFLISLLGNEVLGQINVQTFSENNYPEARLSIQTTGNPIGFYDNTYYFLKMELKGLKAVNKVAYVKLGKESEENKIEIIELPKEIEISQVSVSQYAPFLFICDYQSKLHIWDTRLNTFLKRDIALSEHFNFRKGNYPTYLEIGLDRKNVIVGSASTLIVLNLENNQIVSLNNFLKEKDQFAGMSYVRSHDQIVVGINPKKAESSLIWSDFSGKIIKQKPTGGELGAMRFYKNDTLIYTYRGFVGQNEVNKATFYDISADLDRS